MKNPLQTLLIFLALSLCGLCVWQWYGQVLQRQDMTALAQQVYDQSVAIRGYTNSINLLDRQVAELDGHLTEFRETVKSNQALIVALRQENVLFSNQAVRYREIAEENAKQANEVIRQQNEAIKSVAAERDAYVKQLNEIIKERNEIVSQYNDLVKQVQELQAALTNKTVKK
jgi:chromosome segregation ATPase